MIIDHIGLCVGDYEKSKAFYIKALEPLGIKLLMEVKGWAGFGIHPKPEFWIGPNHFLQKPMHIAFLAESRGLVKQFYKEALAAGGRDNGEPGVRSIYHPNYYGAFVIDPDGHNIEAVCHKVI